MNKKIIAGYEEEKRELSNLRNMLHNADAFLKMGIRIPRGIILYGEPGIGKSVLARSIADEGITLLEVKATCCTENDAEMAIRSAFEQAIECAPSVLLFDELDKLAGISSRYYMEDNSEVNKILLQELDALSGEDAVLVAATCNDPECLGPALLRPGRFDRVISMKAPNEATRKEILELYFSGLKLRRKVDLDYIAKITSGYTGAMLECLVNEAGILAVEKNSDCVTSEEIRTIMSKFAFSDYEHKPSEDIEALRRIAVHEAGHAIVSMYCGNHEIFGASILPQGDSAGHICSVRDGDYAPDLETLEDEVAMLLGGRVAERVVLGKLCFGAESDLKSAAEKVVDLIVRQAAYGYRYLAFTVSPLRFDAASPELKVELDNKLEEIMDRLDRKAEALIREHRDVYDRIVEALMENYTLDGEDLERIRSSVEDEPAAAA